MKNWPCGVKSFILNSSFIINNMEKGEYSYQPHGRNFRIYRCIRSEDRFTQSSPVNEEPLYTNREAARRRVYELNGWKYKAATSRKLRATSTTSE